MVYVLVYSMNQEILDLLLYFKKAKENTPYLLVYELALFP